ncbi:UDP-N-acetylglucosamine--N-acetylmuramyl-(pentapeptide) pyrophosphoryl-undecaprenol N-acetylglucosamine transferase [Candidatus Falkowbacteria bacterium]|nr:UDP-N-acetylglucosamine--N-acetylmuramyl-(pentapeptide) pyrophosphoryl-undecaprenol N-acetylglucosamine transferase [Candidatus Falkowbacteria bacterium]
MKILFSGGGTMGSVSPLLAVAEQLKKEFLGCEMLWLGTKYGPEKLVVEKSNMLFRPICSGKLRRYFSLRNFVDPFKIFIGFCQAIGKIIKFKPDIILVAGSFVAVPVAAAGWLLRKKIVAHQQDILIGLANKLIFPMATRVTVSFEDLLKVCPMDKGVFTGNPIRSFLAKANKELAFEAFKLEKGLPVLLILGGGTGAQAINDFFVKISDRLTEFCQIIHICGAGKLVESTKNSRYHSTEFLTDQLADVYAAADLVITRAGLSTLTELAFLAKPTIIVPIPDSHQENNAAYFSKLNAAIYWKQKELDENEALAQIKSLLNNREELQRLSNNIKGFAVADAAERFVNVVKDLL